MNEALKPGGAVPVAGTGGEEISLRSWIDTLEAAGELKRIDTKVDWDQEIVRVLRPASQPSKYLMYIPAFALLALVVFAQRRRTAATGKPSPQAA